MLALIMTGAVVISQFVSFSYSVLLPTMCVKESSLNLQLVHLVSEQHLSQKTVPGCIVHCLDKGNISHSLVSYSHGIFGMFGDQFNCICAKEGALKGAEHEGENECKVSCPEGDHWCGDSSKDFLSVYCFYDNCHSSHTQSHGLCVDIKNSTEVQGCVRDSDVVWDKVKKVTDFAGHDTNNCTTTCKNMEGDGVAITSFKNQKVSCGCSSLASITSKLLTPAICYSISTLIEPSLNYITCEESHTSAPNPHHAAVISGNEAEMVDHLKLGMDIILFLVCLILILVVVIFVLKKYWRANYEEMS